MLKGPGRDGRIAFRRSSHITEWKDSRVGRGLGVPKQAGVKKKKAINLQVIRPTEQ